MFFGFEDFIYSSLLSKSRTFRIVVTYLWPESEFLKKKTFDRFVQVFAKQENELFSDRIVRFLEAWRIYLDQVNTSDPSRAELSSSILRYWRRSYLVYGKAWKLKGSFISQKRLVSRQILQIWFRMRPKRKVYRRNREGFTASLQHVWPAQGELQVAIALLCLHSPYQALATE